MNAAITGSAGSDAGAPTVAVAHHCEGAGHATRMLAVAQKLETAGYEVALAGGGPGTKFVEENGYEEYEPLGVDFVEAYQRDGGLLDVLRHSAPAMVERVDQYRGWLADEAPAVLVTDDATASLAAAVSSQRYVYLSHDPADFYTTAVERAGAWVRNRIARSTAETFLLPKVWSGEPTIAGAESIPPLAPHDDEVEEDVDVLLVPSAFSDTTDRLATAIEERGRDVTLVGGDDWEVEESLQPYVAGADLVVCSGYSTVMESAVAGTPCVVRPSTSEQRGVVDAVADVDGFYAARSVEDVVALLGRVERPEPQENGAEAVVDAVARIVSP